MGSLHRITSNVGTATSAYAERSAPLIIHADGSRSDGLASTDGPDTMYCTMTTILPTRTGANVHWSCVGRGGWGRGRNVVYSWIGARRLTCTGSSWSGASRVARGH